MAAPAAANAAPQHDLVHLTKSVDSLTRAVGALNNTLTRLNETLMRPLPPPAEDETGRLENIVAAKEGEVQALKEDYMAPCGLAYAATDAYKGLLVQAAVTLASLSSASSLMMTTVKTRVRETYLTPVFFGLVLWVIVKAGACIFRLLETKGEFKEFFYKKYKFVVDFAEFKTAEGLVEQDLVVEERQTREADERARMKVLCWPRGCHLEKDEE
ncbi:unnamed protein product [Cuscuta campestris]|uniref:Uncharacterized protein n=1 Tax=Cuscuta campestris TaxID=132261 RepID=A0A484N8C2_9ASTE|nr:unnamed protein product [Cuscuta campestris]